MTFDDRPAAVGAAPSGDRRTAEAWLAAFGWIATETSSTVEDATAANEDGAAAEYAAIGIESARREFEVDEDAEPARAPNVLTHGELVGRAILRMRLYWGWSQRELECRSGVDQTTISRLEGGVQKGLSVRRLFAILRALRISDVIFRPPVPVAPPTPLELMLHGDPWERAIRAADARLNRRRSA